VAGHDTIFFPGYFGHEESEYDIKSVLLRVFFDEREFPKKTSIIPGKLGKFSLRDTFFKVK